MVTRTKKIFVGGLSAATTLEEVKAYFQRFGEVSFLCFPSLSVAARSLGTNHLPFADWRRHADARQTDKPSQVTTLDTEDADDADAVAVAACFYNIDKKKRCIFQLLVLLLLNLVLYFCWCFAWLRMILMLFTKLIWCWCKKGRECYNEPLIHENSGEFILADADCVVAYDADAVHKVHMMLILSTWLRMKLMHEKQRVVHESSGALVRRTSKSLSLSLNTFN